MTAAEIKTKGEFPMTNIPSMAKEEQAAATAAISSTETYIRVSKMYASFTPKERARVDEFIDFLLYSHSHCERKEEQATAAAAVEMNTQKESYPMTNTNKDAMTNRERILQMYRKLTPENKEKFEIYLDFLLLRQREEEAQG